VVIDDDADTDTEEYGTDRISNLISPISILNYQFSNSKKWMPIPMS
jgi:hypothetical protein